MIPQLFSGFDIPAAYRSVLTIGNFDGVHRGHQFLLREVAGSAHAQNVRAIALTFDPLPLEVLKPSVSAARLSTTADRLRLIQDLGIDLVVPIAFSTEVAALEPRQFIEQAVAAFRPIELIVGADFALGRGRSGNLDVLTALGEEFGYTLRVIARIGDEGSDFSSSGIRACLSAGDVQMAASLLGRPYLLRGIVVQGQRRGRQLGFPTANMAINHRQLVPENGIYAAYSRTQRGKKLVQSMVYVGTNPTFDEQERVVEVNLIDFNDDLYGTELIVLFADRIRADQRFDGVEPLIAQMQHDQTATITRLRMLPAGWPGGATERLLDSERDT